MAEPERIRLPARSTRGKRVSEVVGEDLDADEEFWNQKAFQEEAEDVEYAMEGEMEDVFDSDFDDDEPPDNEEEEAGATEVKERPTKRRLLPPGTKKKPKKPAKAAKKGAGGKKPPTEKGKASERVGEETTGDGAEGETGKSKDGKKSGVGKSRQRRELALLGVGRGKREGGEGGGGEDREEGEEVEELIGGEEEEGGRETVDTGGDASRSRTDRLFAVQSFFHGCGAAECCKVVRKRKEGERRWTQEEMLLEAAQTEILNREALAVMLAREEEVKRKAVVEKAIFGGPQIRFHSKDGKNILEFTKVAAVPPGIDAKAPSYPAKPTCVITGLPAKYRDPLTGQPYATIEAFKVIRQMWQEEQATKKRLRKAAKVEARKRAEAGMEGKAAVAELHQSQHGSQHGSRHGTQDGYGRELGSQQLTTAVHAPARIPVNSHTRTSL
ncbi:unnamed protein product [Closterium sp. Yama58-4]|nr:unnamed protein product [Closterium sp. Yama58-4]